MYDSISEARSMRATARSMRATVVMWLEVCLGTCVNVQ